MLDRSPLIGSVRPPQPLGRCTVMAGKAKRAAARQGELSRRRKKGQRGPSGAPPTAPQQPPNGGGATLAMEAAGTVSVASGAGELEQATAAAAPAPAPAPAPQPTAQPRPPARQRGERPAAYGFVGAELRRIGVLATVAVAALVALSFVL